jgi:hypothetical protein
MRLLPLLVVAAGLVAPMQADRDAGFDRILDTYVRDGLVYYDALRIERANLDRYIGSLSDADGWLERASEREQQAFWVNAYNALVLRTVINAYPIRGKSTEYPVASIAQIPGAFALVKHRVAGKVLTLDEIETVVLGLGEPRLFFALSRGTLGSPRLRSEPYRAAKLDEQLDEAVKEYMVRANVLRIDRVQNVIEVSPLFSWREASIVSGFSKGGEMWTNRSPIERALVSIAYPHLFPSEREYLALNGWQMKFGEYDWRLNDLTGGARVGQPTSPPAN